MNDTPGSLKQEFRSMLLEKSGAERLRMASRMFDAARGMMLTSFPSASSPEQIRSLLLERTYPELSRPQNGG